MIREWSTLAKVVYKRTYSRPVFPGTPLERLERHDETVDRAIMGNVRGHNVSQYEIERLRYFMGNRKAGPAGRGLWFSGTDSHFRIGGVALNNCFSGDTKFWTLGPDNTLRLVAFKDVVGQRLPVLAKDGKWREAEVKSFGNQPVSDITMKVPGRSQHRVKFRATANHRWFTKRGEVTDLRIGDRIVVNPRKPDIECESFKKGFVHGLVFGDGTQHTYYPERFFIRLCGTKQMYLEDIRAVYKDALEARHESSQYEPVVTVKSKDNLKELPAGKDWNYEAGFVAGWMATDGSSRGRLSSTDHEALDWLIERAPMLGHVVVGDTTDSRMETNYGKRNAPVRTVVLKQKAAEYEVEKIVHNDALVEEVFCVVEPETKSFTLEGGIVTGNCWFVTAADWMSYVIACDLLMLGGGVGISVEHRYTSKLPRVKKGVVIQHKATKDADFIVPDSREGWCELLRRVLESFFVTGKSFTYSTVCVRGHGEVIAGFGGTASGPKPLIDLISDLSAILIAREGKHVRPVDAADILCAIGAMVVAGNVRRSAIIVIGDAFDKDYLKAKRWDLGLLPRYRSKANWSVNVEDIEDVHPLFWKTYEHGEPFGIVNMANIRRYGRMGELRKDTAEGVNPCGEATLEPHEPCNLQDIDLPNLSGPEEFFESCRLMQRWGKRVTLERYHIPQVAEVVARNRRIGTSITGCLQSPLFTPDVLDQAYAIIRDADREYSKELGVCESIRNTTLKPSGTKSKMDDVDGEGIHAGWSRYMIQRIRFAANDKLLPLLRDAGHHVEPVIELDGTLNHGTQVVDFYRKAPDDLPCADDGFDLWKQLDTLLMAQRHWSDQAVSVTVTYEKHQIPQIRQWLTEHLKELKSISFLCHSDHGFKQAPKEAITKEQYERAMAKLKPIDVDAIDAGADLEDTECAGGACPVK